MGKYDHIDFKPPQGVQDEAAKGLEWRREYGRGGTEVGVARARDLSNGKNISPETARRMASFFARHEDNKQAEGWSPGDDGFPSAGRIAWALWGGDPGKVWSDKLTRQMDAADKPQARGTMATLHIDGEIGTNEKAFSRAKMAAFLDQANGADVTIYLHSEGGSVYDGMAIHDMLAQYEGRSKIIIQSMAFSIASFIALAADEVEITPNGWMMIHNPYVMAEGSDDELTKVAEQVRALRQKMIDGYARKMGVESAVVQGMMDAETYIDAEQAVEYGLADRITTDAVRSQRQITNQARLPHDVVLALVGPTPLLQEEPVMAVAPQPASARAIKQALPKAKADFIVRCMEKEMSMEEVKDEYMTTAEMEMTKLEEMVEELTEAKAALTQELEQARAKIAAMEEEVTKAKAEKHDDEEKMKARARYRTGGPAVAVTLPTASASASDPKQEWEQVVGEYVARGMTRMNAVKAASRSHAQVRARLVESANS